MATAKKSDPAGAAEVQKKVESDEEKGYRGREVDPTPNSAYSLESGPDAPTEAERRAALKEKS